MPARKVDRARLAFLYSVDWTLDRIARDMGVSVSAIKDNLKTMVLPRRGKGWHPPRRASVPKGR